MMEMEIGPGYGWALKAKERKLVFILNNKLTCSHILTAKCCKLHLVCICTDMCVYMHIYTYILIHYVYYETYPQIVVKMN